MAPLAVVTGGSRGIGRAFVLEAVRRGYRVLFTYRTRDVDAAETARLARELGGDADPLRADLTTFDGITATAAAASRLGATALLVNNAGVTEECSVETMTRQAWERAVALNLTAPAFLVQELRQDLVAERGAVVNVSSDGGVAGSLHGPPYGATKAGLIGLTKTLARDLAPHVRCNAIAPGPVATEMWSSIAPEVQEQVVAREMPLGRIAEPEDIARAGMDVAGWRDATGIVVVLDGGRIM